MALEMVLPENAHTEATLKLERAEKLAELLSLYVPVNTQCEGLMRNCAGAIMEYVHEATALIESATARKGE